MSLPPGTRIPSLTDYEQALLDDAVVGRHVAEALMVAEARHKPSTYYRGLVEGLTLGAVAGALLSACALALAWAHMGG